MPKLDLSTSLEKITAKVMENLPPKLKGPVTKLTPQQQQSMVLATLGGGGFLIIWVIFSLLFNSVDETLDQRAFGPQGAVLTKPLVNTPTAITKSIQAFPQDKAGTEPPKPKPAEPEIKIVTNLTPAQKEQIERLRENVNHRYKSVLPFVLNELKMVSFALAASRIDKVNMRWDTLIAGTPNEALAVEYLSSAQIEIRQLLKNTAGITVEEYDAIYALSTRDTQFNDIANAYKNLVAQGIWGPVTPVIFDGTSIEADHRKNDPNLRFPVAPPREEPVLPVAPSQPPVQ